MVSAEVHGQGVLKELGDEIEREPRNCRSLAQGAVNGQFCFFRRSLFRAVTTQQRLEPRPTSVVYLLWFCDLHRAVLSERSVGSGVALVRSSVSVRKR